jgi:uncharacterized damage-inducible protein DinB
MAHSRSIVKTPSGWNWPPAPACPRELREIVSNLNQVREYLRRAVRDLGNDEVWRRTGEGTPSIGNLLMHLRGSEHQWIGNKLGGRVLDRDRDAEFATRAGPGLSTLLEQLDGARRETEAILARLADEDVAAGRYGGHSAQFILHYTAQHFAYHVGQVVMIRKFFEPSFVLYDD